MQLRVVVMWTCSYCGKTLNQKPEAMKCPDCGITLGQTNATKDKFRILKDICELNDYDLLIDACAGSGAVQLLNGDIINGSALLFEEIAKKRTPPARHVHIEVEPKTYRLLRHRFCSDSDAKFINDDCNQHLLNLVDGETRTLVFIDPFGYGIPAIRRDMVIKLSAISNTDLLINFTWRIAREMGHARRYLFCTIDRCPSPTQASEKVSSCDDCHNRKRAKSYAKSASTWWGGDEWLNWGSLSVRTYVERYASPFRQDNEVSIYRIPRYSSKSPTYQLIFASKFESPQYGLLRFLKS